MADNIQINVWRGTNPPPTNYHMWVKDDSEILIYTNNLWASISGGKELIELISNILEDMKNLKEQVTVHNDNIKDLQNLLKTLII